MLPDHVSVPVVRLARSVVFAPMLTDAVPSEPPGIVPPALVFVAVPSARFRMPLPVAVLLVRATVPVPANGP
jgi:hypothetical protein